MADINIEYYDESYVRVVAEPSITYEMIDYFSFLTEGYRFNPKFKMGIWDGKIRLMTHQGLLPYGLVEQAKKFASNMMYSIEIDPSIYPEEVISREDFDKWIESLDIYAGSTKITPHWYQGDTVFHCINERRAVANLPTSAGKAQPLDRKILTPNGWSTMGEMEIGSKVLSPNGDIANVIAVHPQGVKEIYEIEFKDGRKTQSCGEHLWKIFSHDFSTTDDKWRTMSLNEIMDLKGSRTRYIQTPVIEYPDTDLPIDPYLLGVLIGDGSLSQCQKTITTMDIEIENQCRVALPEGITFSKKEDCDSSKAWLLSIVGETRSNGKDSDHPLSRFKKTLNDFGLNTTSYHKSIPEIYKTSSINQRYRMIQGLIDTDGFVGKNGAIGFSTTSITLANDVVDIIRSLGGYAKITEKTTNSDFGKCYVVSINVEDKSRCTTLPRKLNRLKSNSRWNNRLAIKKITKVESQPAQCITIDSNDHLYITDDYIVTHNSLIQSLLSKWYLENHKDGGKVLIIVPTTALVQQMRDDFLDYRLFSHDDIYMIKGGVDRSEAAIGNARIVVSTWQSAVKESKEWFDQFGMLEVDECHLATGKSLDGIIKKMTSCKYKIGLTGSLRDGKANLLQYVGSFGDIFRPVSTAQLMEEGQVTDLNINCLMLEYPQPIRDELKGVSYQEEMKWLLSNKHRNKFLIKLAYNLSAKKGENTLLLFKNIKHGKLLYEALSKIHDKVFYVSGETNTDKRTEVKKLAEDIDGAIIVASYGVFSTGISIKKLHNVIFAHPTKSKVINLQSIGRVLRKHGSKVTATLYDIIDNLAIKPKRKNAKKLYTYVNYTMKHGLERIELYNREHFKYKIRKCDIA